MMSRVASLCIAAWALAVGLLWGRTDAAEPAGKAYTGDQLAQLVRHLDSPEFLTRETAMLELLRAGPAAIPALRPVLAQGGLEATSRTLWLLQQLALAADVESPDEAGQLLLELAEQKETPALARRAAGVLAELHEQRRVRALAELEGLGAKVARNQFFGGLPLDESVLSVEIGPGFQGSERDLKRLRWLHDVPVLVLTGEKITDAWVQPAAEMPSLQELHLYDVRISDAALVPFAEPRTAPAGLPPLSQLGVYYTPVGDKLLEPLSKLPLLSHVKLYGTKITPAGVEVFSQAAGIVKSRIDLRRGAFLGIGSLPIDGTCLISTVHEGSPADKGGLMREDVVVRFGDAKVTDFNSLTALISERDAGDEVEVEVLRRTLDDQGNQVLRNVTLKVTLAPWQLDLAVRNGPRP